MIFIPKEKCRLKNEMDGVGGGGGRGELVGPLWKVHCKREPYRKKWVQTTRGNQRRRGRRREGKRDERVGKPFLGISPFGGGVHPKRETQERGKKAQKRGGKAP